MSRTSSKNAAMGTNDPKQTAAPINTPSSEGKGEPRKGPCFKVGPIPTDASGHSVEACVWDREVTSGDGRAFTVYSISCQASYRDETGTWQKTSSFRSSQIPVLVYCFNKCFDWVQSQRERSQDSSAEA